MVSCFYIILLRGFSSISLEPNWKICSISRDHENIPDCTSVKINTSLPKGEYTQIYFESIDFATTAITLRFDQKDWLSSAHEHPGIPFEGYRQRSVWRWTGWLIIKSLWWRFTHLSAWRSAVTPATSWCLNGMSRFSTNDQCPGGRLPHKKDGVLVVSFRD